MGIFKQKLGSRDESGDNGSLTLRRLLVWLEQPLERLKYLNIVLDAIKGFAESLTCINVDKQRLNVSLKKLKKDKKGGILLSTLYTYSIHGDSFKSSLLKSGLTKVTSAFSLNVTRNFRIKFILNISV